MSVLDKIRVETAVQRYDLALDLKGVRGAQRRSLRRELRANLSESAANVGASAAIEAIGSPEQLASECAAAVRDPRRPAWSLGLAWAASAVAAYWLLVLWSSIAFLDGVIASGVSTPVTGRITLLGLDVTAEHSQRTLAVGGTLGPAFWLVSLGIFVVVLALAARLWRLLRRTAS